MSEQDEKVNPVPAGYRRNAVGHLVPEELIDEVDKLRDELVLQLMGKVETMAAQLAQLKQIAFEEITAFVELSVETYKVKQRGTKGNLTLYSFDGSRRIEFACRDKIAFDERLQAAKSLIDRCIDEWSEGTRPEIRALIQNAFVTDREGKLQPGRILQLRRLKIEDPRWKEAMQAIADGLQVVGTKWYVRFYRRRGATNKYDQISLDIASA